MLPPVPESQPGRVPSTGLSQSRRCERAMNSWMRGILEPNASLAARRSVETGQRFDGVPVHKRQVVIAGVARMADPTPPRCPSDRRAAIAVSTRPGRAGPWVTDRFAPARRSQTGSVPTAVLARWPVGSSRRESPPGGPTIGTRFPGHRRARRRPPRPGVFRSWIAGWPTVDAPALEHGIDLCACPRS